MKIFIYKTAIVAVLTLIIFEIIYMSESSERIVLGNFSRSPSFEFHLPVHPARVIASFVDTIGISCCAIRSIETSVSFGPHLRIAFK